jgi:hypothetical protein
MKTVLSSDNPSPLLPPGGESLISKLAELGSKRADDRR